MPDPTRKDLLKKLSGKKVFLTTRCGTFSHTSGTVKEVFDSFMLFATVDERFRDQPATRNWVWLDNVGVVTEDQMPQTEDMAITRFE